MAQLVIKLTNDDLIIGEMEAVDENTVSVVNPYSVYDFGQGPAVAPYMLPILMESMEQVSIRNFDIMWSKALAEFPQVEAQYISATTGIEQEPKEKIIL